MRSSARSALRRSLPSALSCRRASPVSPVAASARPLCVVPHRLLEGLAGRWRWRVERLLPAAEPDPGEQRRRQVVLQEREAAGHLNGHLGGQFVGALDREFRPSTEGGGGPQEVDVVGVVGDRVEPLGVALRDVVEIGGDRALVGRDGVVVAADADVDVSRHVDQVAGGGHELAEGVRARLGEVRFPRFHQVDVVVVRARVVGMRRDHLFEEFLRLQGARLRLAAAPVVPGHRVHDRRGVQGGRLRIVGELLGYLRDGVDPGCVESRPVGVLVGGVAARQSADQRLFPLARVLAPVLCLLQALERLKLALARHRVVQVAAQGQGLAPVRHRRLRVEPRGLLEGANGLGVVEGVDETKPLIEETLRRVRRGRDGVVEVAQALQRGRERRAGVVGCDRGDSDGRDRERDDDGAQDASADPHGGQSNSGGGSAVASSLGG